MVAGHLHRPVQSAPQFVRPPVQRALQILDPGWQRQWLLEGGLRLRPLESGPGEVSAPGPATEALSLEQLPGVLETVAPTPGLGAGGWRRFGSIMEERKGGRAEGEFKTMRRGWYLGGQAVWAGIAGPDGRSD